MVTLFAVILSATAMSDQAAEPAQQPPCSQDSNQLRCLRGDPSQRVPPRALRQQRLALGVRRTVQIDVSFGSINSRLPSRKVGASAGRSTAGKAHPKAAGRCEPPEVSTTTLWVPTARELRCRVVDGKATRKSAGDRRRGRWVPEAVVGSASVLAPGPSSMVPDHWHQR